MISGALAIILAPRGTFADPLVAGLTCSALLIVHTAFYTATAVANPTANTIRVVITVGGLNARCRVAFAELVSGAVGIDSTDSTATGETACPSGTVFIR